MTEDTLDEKTGLPRHIEADGIGYELGYGEIDDSFWLAYTSYRGWPNKKVFIHREESSLERCIEGAKRKLAELRAEWRFL